MDQSTQLFKILILDFMPFTGCHEIDLIYPNQLTVHSGNIQFVYYSRRAYSNLDS